MMGAPGTARWIAAQKAARVRLRNEMLARALRRFVIGAALLIVLLLVAPALFASDAATVADRCPSLEAGSLVFGVVVGWLGGMIAGTFLAVYRLTRPHA